MKEEATSRSLTSERGRSRLSVSHEGRYAADRILTNLLDQPVNSAVLHGCDPTIAPCLLLIQMIVWGITDGETMMMANSILCRRVRKSRIKDIILVIEKACSQSVETHPVYET